MCLCAYVLMSRKKPYVLLPKEKTLCASVYKKGVCLS